MGKLAQLWFLGLILTISSCSLLKSKDTGYLQFEQEPGTLATICGDKWRLKLLRINGEAINISRPSDFTFLCNREGQVVGKSGVNTYRGVMAITNSGHIVWDTDSFASTKKTASEELISQENKYLYALAGSRRALLKNGGARLILRDTSGNIYIDYIKSGY
ncbi:MAG: META domain-containing protein [Gammaproteobacteria bacterium]|nr:META domain-containing protein [Gammaproteobacteria bacterium]